MGSRGHESVQMLQGGMGQRDAGRGCVDASRSLWGKSVRSGMVGYERRGKVIDRSCSWLCPWVLFICLEVNSRIPTRTLLLWTPPTQGLHHEALSFDRLAGTRTLPFYRRCTAAEQGFSAGGWFCRPENIWPSRESISIVASSGYRPDMLLNTPQCTEQPQQQRIIPAKIPGDCGWETLI